MPGMIHIHTDGSLLDGACNIDKLCKRAIELGYNFLGITDHGNMINALKFQKTCEKYNIKPLIGCEFYFGEPETEDRFHLVLIAKNNKGLENLYKLNRYAYEKNFYYKPRIDTESLCMYREGLICTTACLGSEFAKNKDNPNFENIVNKFYSIFQSDFYLELQSNNIPEQQIYNAKLLNLSRNGFKYIMTCDTHYVNKEDFDAHDTMLCMQTQKKKEDTNRFRFSENSFYLKSPAELFSYDNAILRHNCERDIQELADKCDAHIELDQNLMPHLYDSQEENRILAEHCNVGFKKRIADGYFAGYDMQEVVKRVYYELNILKIKGYSGYFLIVEDFINWAKSKDIYVGAGRGSACGSEIAFILGITEVEPIKYGLLFERFLNPDRNSPPDIDSDFEYERREEVFEYMAVKYGVDNIARIMAKGTLTTKSVFRKVLGVYDFDMQTINRLSKTIPEDVANLTIEKSYDLSEPFKSFCDAHKSIYENCKVLEGLISHISTHAAGVVLCKDVTSKMPCMVSDGKVITQWDKKEVEAIGAYKFDFLGLKTLTIIKKTINSVNRRGGHLTYSDLLRINLEDENIFKTINSGDLYGVFQFDAPEGGKVIGEIEPNCFNDIIAGEALCRPGVIERKLYLANKKLFKEHGTFPVPTYWNNVKDILQDTYGAIVFQEQTMLLMQRIAGWTLGFADKMRKVKDLSEYKEQFLNDAHIANIASDEEAEEIFNRFDLSYSFNKSHAVAYAVVTMITAYLATYHYIDFMAAVMSVELIGEGNKEASRIPEFIRACRRKGINVFVPRINVSTNDFDVLDDTDIICPLTFVKGVGEKNCEAIVSERNNHGLYTGLVNFLARVPKKLRNKTVSTNLIKAGTFNGFGHRFNLLNQFNNLQGIPNVNIPSESRFYALAEQQMLGLPFTKYGNTVDMRSIHGNTELASLAVTIGKVKVIKDRNHNNMAFLTVSTYYNDIECVVFSYIYERLSGIIKAGTPVTMTGKWDGKSIVVSNIV